jgi:hypothetical protein
METKKGSLTRDQKKWMSIAGFIPTEIKQFDGSPDVEFASPTFQKMMDSRRAWRDSLLNRGVKRMDIARRVLHWYRIKKQRSVWALFRVEYGMTMARKKLDKNTFSQMVQAKRQVSRTFGKSYGKARGYNGR